MGRGRGRRNHGNDSGKGRRPSCNDPEVMQQEAETLRRSGRPSAAEIRQQEAETVRRVRRQS